MISYRTKTASAFRARCGSEPSRCWPGGVALAVVCLALFAPAAEAQFSGGSSEGSLPFDPFQRPESGPGPSIVNPGDSFSIQIPGVGGTDGASQILDRVGRLGDRLGRASLACGQSAGDVGRYLSCVSDALDAFGAGLDQISTRLPPGMRNVASIVETASNDIARLRSDADRRLAAATTDAEREQIRRETVAAAAQTMATAAGEIRKSISLIRATDPDLANVQRETVLTVAQAVDDVGIQLSRAVGL